MRLYECKRVSARSSVAERRFRRGSCAPAWQEEARGKRRSEWGSVNAGGVRVVA